MLLIGKDLILQGQKQACAVYQINHGQPVFHGDLLGTKVFLGSHREPCAGLYRGIVGNDQALTSRHRSYARHHTS